LFFFQIKEDHVVFNGVYTYIYGIYLKEVCPQVHYESKTVPEEAGARLKAGAKKAALFSWITLQSIPEETLISPHILEFLEQTLEPIPTKAFSTPTPGMLLPLARFEIVLYCVGCSTLKLSMEELDG
jgi:hypothetical protein